MSTVILESVQTCPHCGSVKQETMPTDACQFYYEWQRCNAMLRPEPGTVACSVLLDPCHVHPFSSRAGAASKKLALVPDFSVFPAHLFRHKHSRGLRAPDRNHLLADFTRRSVFARKDDHGQNVLSNRQR